MYILSPLVVLIFGLQLRVRYIWGFSSSIALKSSQLLPQLAFPIDNHAGSSEGLFTPFLIARNRPNVIRPLYTATSRLDGSVGVLVNSKLSFINTYVPQVQPAIVRIQMRGNVSDLSDDKISSTKSNETQPGEPLRTRNATNSSDDYCKIVINNDSCDDVLAYLGDSVSIMPPQTQDLLRRVTYNYVYGTNDDIITLQEIASIIEQEHRSRDVPVQILASSTRANATNIVVFEADVTKTGEAFDELCSELLSLGALYQLPKEIILELLSTPIHAPSSRTSTSSILEYSNSVSSTSAIIKCRAAFAAVGWNGVVFPMGLAIRPKTKFRSVWNFAFVRSAFRDNTSNRPEQLQNESVITSRNGENFIHLSWWHRTKTLRDIAAVAVRKAADVRSPPRCLIDRRQYLNSLDAQLRLLSTSPVPKMDVDPIIDMSMNVSDPAKTEITTASLSPFVAPGFGLKPSSSSSTGQFFFPDTNRQWWQTLVPRRSVSNTLRALRRVASQQYSALKRQGRAGLVSYCLFNFLYYSIGILWQWPRMPILQADPISDLASSIPRLNQPQFTASALLLRKFGKIFAYLYAFSQVLKVPKLCTAVGLAPLTSKCLDTVKNRFGVNETTATAMLVGLMVVAWVALISIPILSEYSSLQHIFYLEKQLIHVYGLQPV
jgi:hypothetical protein